MDRDSALKQGAALVRAGRPQEAEPIFRTLLADDPEDLEARVWLARLESYEQRYAAAERDYRAVLARKPDAAEAGLGLCDALIWSGDLAEAEVVLAPYLRADDAYVHAEALVREGRIAQYRHHTRKAKREYQEALRLQPGSEEASSRLLSLSSESSWGVEAGYGFEQFGGGVPNTTLGFAQISYSNLDRLTLLARTRMQSKFGEFDPQGTVGATYRTLQHTYLSGDLSVAPGSVQVVPHVDVGGAVAQALSRASVGAGLRRLWFRGADVYIPSVNVDVSAAHGVDLSLHYTPARTDFGTHAVWNSGGWGKVGWKASALVSPYVSLGLGTSDFLSVSRDQLGSFSAQTYGTGVRLQVSERRYLAADYYYQHRSSSLREQGLAIRYGARF